MASNASSRMAACCASLSPPWGTTDYQQIFNALKKSPEFKLLFADRVHRLHHAVWHGIRGSWNQLEEAERKALIESSPVFGKYEDAVDRESAFEVLQKRKGDLLGGTKPGQPGAPAAEGGGIMDTVGNVLSGVLGTGSGTSRRQSGGEAFMKSIMRSMGSRVGTEIARGVLGSIFGGSKRR